TKVEGENRRFRLSNSVQVRECEKWERRQPGLVKDFGQDPSRRAHHVRADSDGNPALVQPLERASRAGIDLRGRLQSRHGVSLDEVEQLPVRQLSQKRGIDGLE